ncbi:riboflavin biosynthesis protein RibD [Veronia nyctiphanis]|uniref:Riboflavin biosynthesis protein RibD n=1 Tax=Veronia nyctiphanis TaxID=1278244 RepID=A0A4Q0YR77_9GAMM|nr:bifunctional diaminohydroxyphosphoribosylaminopyrimidine deaminase/5-amino-6-(5-phosphoribosylamino)uracil reductase RibD [Veronia nyctiphanis]RXJ73115.1 riboflavin biosynthesis protein RibD [Veronia nyctiphanis]
MFSDFDTRMMERALALAALGRFTTAPNPRVGCVITQGEHIVGEGFHQRAGEAHAEVFALRAAAEKASGATAYVTLEPCSHFGRTPPCANALIDAGVKRVVCAMVDPNPEVAGRGINRMRDAGIEVDVGLKQTDAETLNAPFIKFMTTGMPYVQLKLASTLDGRTALANGDSKWITGAEARADVQVYRAMSGAILSTSQTVIDDNPSLNVRWAQLPEDIQQAYPETSLRQPIRVILDRQSRVKPDAHLFSLKGEVIMVHDSANDNVLTEQTSVTHANSNEAGFDLHDVMLKLAAQGINHVWVEAGANLAGALLKAGLVDELIVYQAPKVIGADGRPLLALSGLESMSDVPEFILDDVTRVGNDIRMTLRKQ